MANYVIQETNADSVYCVVTLDNGASFGQYVYGEASKTIEGVDAAIAQAIARVAVSEKSRDAAVMDAVRKTRVLETAGER